MADRLGSFLHEATEAEAYVTLQELLEVGANVNHVNEEENGETPLMLACVKGPVNIVRLFIEHGANVHARDVYGYLALHRLCAKHFHDRWAEADMDPELRRLEKVRLLIANGVDPSDDQNVEGESALHLAALDGFEQIVRFLVQSGASVDPVTKQGETPLHLAVMNRRLGIVQCLVQNGAKVGWETLEKACIYGCLEILDWLVANGASLNITNDQGRTLLHHAVLSHNHMELLEVFYQHGIDINARDENGMTPLLGALLVDHTTGWRHKFHGNVEREWSIRLETIQSLAEHGANLNIADNDGKTPLHVACQKSRFETVEFLVENGATINSQDNQGVTPLHRACQRGHLQVAQLLLTRGANVEIKTKQGLTPLHLACLENHSDVVWCLVRQSLWLLSPADAT